MNYMEEFKAIRVAYSKAFLELMNGTLQLAQVNSYLIPFWPNISYYTPWKYQKGFFKLVSLFWYQAFK